MRSLPVIVALSLAASTSLHAADGAQPGMWEYSIKTEMPGMPFAMPAVTTQQCLKPEDAKQGAIYKEEKSECKLENLKQSGNKTSYDIVCAGDNPTKGHYDFTVAATSMQGLGTLDLGGGQTMKQNFTGKRVGDCK